MMRLTNLLSKKQRSFNLMAMWIDYGMFGFFLYSNIKSKYQCSHRIAVRLTDLLSKSKDRIISWLCGLWIDYGMFGFCLKYGYIHRVSINNICQQN